MRKYVEILLSQIKVDTAYNAWYWSGTISMIFRMLVIYAFWQAVYQSKTEISGMSIETMITYIVIATALNSYVSGVGVQLATNVYDGSVAIELMRPYNLLDKLVAVDLGNKITRTFRDVVPMLLVAYLFIGINAPHRWTDFPLFIASTLLGVLIGTQLDLVLGIMAFWFHNIMGLQVFRNAILLFFSGALLPISMFPDWLQVISKYLPFQSMVYVPVSIYTGQLAAFDAWYAILMQLLWLVIIFTAIRLTWSFAIRKVTIFGG